ncbi:MAG: bifunctional UDP-sugar hydrolase/5'-nucleotidase [Vulcanimicrobiota bacterium]
MNISTKRLQVVFTTDEHGAIRSAPAAQKAIDEMRAESPGQSLVISGGDVFQGAPESEMDHGKPALELIPKAGYDVVALGNHDFDYGQDFLREWTSQATYPILSANVHTQSGQLLPGVHASVIKEMDGFRVGLIGVTTQTTPAISFAANVKGLSFDDPVPTVQAEVKKLREQGVHVIGLISHTEEQEEERIAAAVPGLDFILAGHTHQLYQHPKMASGVPVYRSGSSREAVGKLSIELDPTSLKPTAQSWEIIPCGQETRHDGEVQQLIDSQVKRYDAEMNRPAAFTISKLITTHSPEGDDMDEIVAKEIATQAGTKIGFHNQKTVRDSLKEGLVTRGDAMRVFPFPNRVQKVSVSYNELLRAVRLSEERKDHTSLFFHGLTIERDAQGQAIRLRDLQGKVLPARLEVGTTDFIAGGGLNYFESPKSGPASYLLSDILPEAVANRGWEKYDRACYFQFTDRTDYAL